MPPSGSDGPVSESPPVPRSKPTRAAFVLIVEDDEGTAELERRVLARAGFEPHVVSRIADALSTLEIVDVAAVLLDFHLPDGNAWQVVDAAGARTPRVPVILVTAMGNEDVAVEAIHRGVADYLKKTDAFWELLPMMMERVIRTSQTEIQLRVEQARLAEAQRIAQIGSWEWDIPNDRVTWSDELYRIFGRDKQAFGASYEAFLDCIHPSDRGDVHAVIGNSYAKREGFRNVYRTLRDGNVRFIEGRGRVFLGADGSVVRMAGTAQDVTEREEQQAKLRESAAFFEQSLDMLSTASTDGYFRSISPAFKILGYSEEELLSTPFIELVHPDDVPATIAEVEKLKQGIKTIRFVNRYRCKDGSFRWIAWTSSPSPDGILYGTGRDITAEKRAEEERELLNRKLQSLNSDLTNTLREREVLLKEIHHRVKNNLQVISSLINLQMNKLEAGENRDALEECRHRVFAIALIHEKLYQSPDYARVPFAQYAESLAASVLAAGRLHRSNIRLDLAVENVALAVDQAIPCGLVLNELMSNALKHGFNDGRAGTIRVEFARISDSLAQLAVTNDGKPLPDGFDVKATRSLGIHLVSALARQLEAKLEVERSPRTTFRLQFPLPELQSQ